ncbi:hypothetical protein LXL04_019496 [Taraxacum kok-saghyz]
MSNVEAINMSNVEAINFWFQGCPRKYSEESQTKHRNANIISLYLNFVASLQPEVEELCKKVVKMDVNVVDDNDGYDN